MLRPPLREVVVSALEIRGLDVSLGGTPILHGIDLTVSDGEAVALLGPSGSGKTTLLYAVAGFVTPTGGEIAISGRVVSGLGRFEPSERRSVGFVFQNYALWPHLTAGATVAYPLERAGMTPEDATLQAGALLAMVGIAELSGRKPAELSGGQQQRVGLARAMARHASVYLLDEPTAHLDSALRADVQEELAVRMTADGAAAIYATHDSVEAMAIADRVVLMREGRIVQSGAPDVVYSRPVDLWAARLTGPAWELDGAVVGEQAGRVVVRPDWVEPDGGLSGRITAVWFRGPFTDYRIETAAGSVEMRRPGAPEWVQGDGVSVRVVKWWAVED